MNHTTKNAANVAHRKTTSLFPLDSPAVGDAFRNEDSLPPVSRSSVLKQFRLGPRTSGRESVGSILRRHIVEPALKTCDFGNHPLGARSFVVGDDRACFECMKRAVRMAHQWIDQAAFVDWKEAA